MGGIPESDSMKESPTLENTSLPLWGGYSRDSWGERAVSASSPSSLFVLLSVVFIFAMMLFRAGAAAEKGPGNKSNLSFFFHSQNGIITYGKLFPCLYSYIVFVCEKQEAHKLCLPNQSLSKCAKRKRLSITAFI